jgi:hypothetical protein
MADTIDPHFCNEAVKGTSRADAIVDVDDGDPADGTVRFGVRYQDDDVVTYGTTPRFRVWTGPKVEFQATGAASNMAIPDCNDRFEVHYRYRPLGTVAWTPLAWAVAVPARAATDCYADADMVGAPLWPAPSATAPMIEVQYRVTTWREGARPQTERSSVKPGNDLWSRPPDGIAPAVFFVK